MNYELLPRHQEASTVTEQILISRGFKKEEIHRYLHTTEDDLLDPHLLKNMAEAARLLVRHVKEKNKIFIQVDSDCDGYTSAALLYNYLYRVAPTYVENYIVYRLHEGKQHGLLVDTIPSDVKLVIAPDSSSNEYEIHAQLKEKGIDVLVLDHHDTDKESSNACVVNNQLCGYPNKGLSGVGVVFKLCQFLSQKGANTIVNEFYDLAALGIIGDMMDLKSLENKYIITRGLSGTLNNPWFNLMVEENAYSIGGELTPIGVAFYVVPYINATIRVGTMEQKVLLFESMLLSKAYEEIPSTKRGCKGQMETRVTQACRNCRNIKNKQAKTRDKDVEFIQQVIKEKALLNNKILVIPTCSDLDRNLTGLIANQLMSKYQRPVLLLNLRPHALPDSEEVEYWWEGSARGYEKSALSNLKDYVKSTGLVQYAEGHGNAFGVGIKQSDLNSFIEKVNSDLADFTFSANYKVDFIYNSPQAVSEDDIFTIAKLKSIWGQGISEPYIVVEMIKLTKDNVKLMSPDKNPTLKILLSTGVVVIKFHSSQGEYKDLLGESEDEATYLTVVGKCSINEYMGTSTAQILVESFIVEESRYDF